MLRRIRNTEEARAMMQIYPRKYKIYFFSLFKNKRMILCHAPTIEKMMSITESIEQNKRRNLCVLSKKF